MRSALQTVLAADCDSLTDCSCGLATTLPGSPQPAGWV